MTFYGNRIELRLYIRIEWAIHWRAITNPLRACCSWLDAKFYFYNFQFRKMLVCSLLPLSYLISIKNIKCNLV